VTAYRSHVEAYAKKYAKEIESGRSFREEARMLAHAAHRKAEQAAVLNAADPQAVQELQLKARAVNDNMMFLAGVDYVGEQWEGPGIEKLISTGLWERVFVRGHYGSPDAQLKTRPPAPSLVLAALGRERLARDAERAAAARNAEVMSRPSLVTTAVPETPKAPDANSIWDEVIRETNARLRW
jgi:hypothetical protein